MLRPYFVNADNTMKVVDVKNSASPTVVGNPPALLWHPALSLYISKAPLLAIGGDASGSVSCRWVEPGGAGDILDTFLKPAPITTVAYSLQSPGPLPVRLLILAPTRRQWRLAGI